MNSENSKTSDPQRLPLNLSDKIKLKGSDKYVSLSNLSIYDTWKNIKTSYKYIKFKISAPTWNEEFELPDGSYYVQIFKIILSISSKNMRQLLIIRIYVNKIENRITFKLKTGYYLELLTPAAMELLGSTKCKITKDESGKNVSLVYKLMNLKLINIL